MAAPFGAIRFDIADIVRAHRKQLEASYRLSSRQRRVLTDIAQCRTQALGGHLELCDACGFERAIYPSCRNRHCPKCQALAQEKWIDNQRQRMLDVTHFHVVFTLPAELRPLCAFAPRVLYEALFHAAERTLIEFAARNLDATIGATLVLHTWARDLTFHPHVHAIVTGGGLARDETTFRKRGRSFLFPVTAMALVSRAKLLDLLWQANRRGDFARFDDFQDPEGFASLINRLPKRWHCYAKPSFDNGRAVMQYLGRYTHRVGIANSRLLFVDDDSVTFKTKGGKTATLHPVEFLRRLVQHVLPDGFHKIRHIGLNASCAKRQKARLALQQPLPEQRLATWKERLSALTGRDVCICPKCKAALRQVPLDRSRAPPSTLQARIAA